MIIIVYLLNPAVYTSSKHPVYIYRFNRVQKNAPVIYMGLPENLVYALSNLISNLVDVILTK